MISVVIPCYNCSSYISGHLARLSAFLAAHFESFEIIAVDDGSGDGTLAVLQAAAARDAHIKVLPLARNRGKGAAVKAGMLASRGDFVLFTDADLPYDLPAIPAFVDTLQSGYDVVLGSRLDDGEVNGQAMHRTFLSRLFAALANVALFENVPDTQAGIKGFTKQAAQKIFTAVTLPRFCFDVEVIALAQKYRMKITSIPVRLVNQAPSSVQVGRDGLRMCADLAYIFFKYRLHS